MNTLAFFAFSAVAIACAIVVVAAGRVVSSALALVVCFLAVAGLFILQGAEFLGAVQVLLYAGSIVVLFIFVVMMMNLRDRERNDWGGPHAFGGFFLGLAIFAQLAWMLARTRGLLAAPSNPPWSDEGHIQALGKVLFRDYLLPFEILSVILLAALFGILVIGRRKR